MSNIFIVFGVYYPDADKPLKAFRMKESAETYLKKVELKIPYDSVYIKEVELEDT